MPTESNRSVFFTTTEFAELFTVATGTFSGIFDDPFTDVDDIESSHPTILTDSGNIATYSLVRGLSVLRVGTSISYCIREFHWD